MIRRDLLSSMLGVPALLLAACGGSDEDDTEELPLLPLNLSLAGLHDVPAGTWLFRSDADVADFLARYEYPTQVCDSAGHCVPGHSTPPPVDYLRHAVAGVSAGAAGSCESMTLTRVVRRGDTAVLHVTVSRPDPAAGIACPTVVTWMTAFVRVPATVTRVEMLRS